MRTPNLLFLFLSASLIPCPATELRVVDQDARAVARANAFVATADNASAVYYNPAAITELPGHNVRAGFLGRFSGLEHTAPDGTKTSVDSDFTALPQFFYSCSYSNIPVAFGLGIYSPFYSDTEWPKTAPTTIYNRIYRQEIGTIQPVLAVPIGKTLSLGAGPTFNAGRFQNRMGADHDSVFTENKGDGGGFGYTVGLFWTPHVKHSFGLTYRSGVDMRFHGETTIQEAVPWPANVYKDTFAFTLPPSIAAGYSFRPTTNWNIEADIEWTDWSTYWRTFGINKGSSYTFSLGATRKFGAFDLNFGYRFYEGYGDDVQPLPSSPETNHHLFSIGVGRRFSKWQVDLTYQYDYGTTFNAEGFSTMVVETANGPVYQTLNGKYNPSNQSVLLSFGRAF